jgi:hypothetical protein
MAVGKGGIQREANTRGLAELLGQHSQQHGLASARSTNNQCRPLLLSQGVFNCQKVFAKRGEMTTVIRQRHGRKWPFL